MNMLEASSPEGRPAVPSRPPLLRVQGLRKHFPVVRSFFGRPTGWVLAVDGVDLHVAAGETLGLVGESGSGKSTLGRCILRLTPPTAGQVEFDGTDLLALKGRSLRRFRRHLQLIFQDPHSSLNPRMTVGSLVGEPLAIHGLARGEQQRQRVAELLEMVGLDPDCSRRYPHEFSGGQRQRIGIARALAPEPRLIVADEPVSALDVSVQAQVLNLLSELQERLGVAYLLISHDLSVVRHMADRVAVMYLGRIIEEAPSASLYRRPLHPYTRTLLDAVPVPDPAARRRRTLTGEPVAGTASAGGCAFQNRCPLVEDRCRTEVPPLIEHAPEHRSACWLVESGDDGPVLPPST